jgi:hypothetical protein
VAFLGGYFGVALLFYVFALVSETGEGARALSIGFLGAVIATPPTSIGFALGTLLWGKTFSALKCIGAGALVTSCIAIVASPIGDMSPASKGEFVANVVYIGLFVVCLVLPSLARPARKATNDVDRRVA